MGIAINQPVPDMTLEMYQNGIVKKRTLTEFKGQWLVLFFYPADFSAICPTELKEAASRYEEIKKMGAELVSISTDSVATHQAWHDSSPALKTITFPMAADPGGKLAKIFGTYIKEEGISLRGTFIIDPNSILKAMEIHDNRIGRSISEIIRKLTVFKYALAKA